MFSIHGWQDGIGVERLGHEGTAIRHAGFVNVRLDHKFSVERLIEVEQRRARDVWNCGNRETWWALEIYEKDNVSKVLTAAVKGFKGAQSKNSAHKYSTIDEPQNAQRHQRLAAGE